MLPAEDSTLTGDLGELTFERHFLSQRCLIARPRSDVFRVDYLLEWNGHIVKINVKTMSRQMQGNGNTFTTTLTASKNGRRATYIPTDIDYFGVVNLEYDRIWMVPLSATIGKTGLAWVPPDLRKRTKRTAFDWDKYQIK